MQNGEYWKKRGIALENMTHQDAMTTSAYIDQQCKIAQKEIDDQIRLWYQKFADNNAMSMAEATKVLNSSEVKEFKMTLNEYIKHGEELALDDSWLQKMKSASAVHHIERLEALKMETQQSCEVLYKNQLDAMDDLVRKAYTDNYYHEAFNIQQGTGVGVKLNAVNQEKLSTLVKKPWTPDGEEFSGRIWKNKAKLIDTLNTELSQSCITGRSIEDISKRIADKMNVSASNAKRLAQTEAAHFASAGDQDAYSDMGLKQYQILATLDDRTSEICQDMDGQIFDMSEWEDGVTAPPFHANCRTTTIPYFNDEFTAEDMRAAIGEDGKTYDVPANMTYKDWKNSFC
jgi:SPP1 gp7 family putative phage head morphogenesis protein